MRAAASGVCDGVREAASAWPRDAIRGRAREAELRAAIDNLQKGVVIVDRTGRVIVRNRSAERVLGVTHLDALVDEAVEAHLRGALAGRDTSDTLDVRGPPRCTLVVRGSAIVIGGEIVGAVGTIEDVSERTAAGLGADRPRRQHQPRAEDPGRSDRRSWPRPWPTRTSPR